jgi:ketosteroid isomerase-like protein
MARGAALRLGDAAALAALLADDLRYTHSTGRVETRAEAVNGLATRAVVYERFVTFDHHAAVITSDVVALNGRIDQRKLSGGKASDARLFFLAVWRRADGAWRLVSLQTAATPPPG